MENMRKYEALFIIDPEKEGEMEEVMKGINAIIKENAGAVDNENLMGRRALAYPMDKKTEGVYCTVAFSAQPDSIAKLTRQCEINNDILRTVITKKSQNMCIRWSS